MQTKTLTKMMLLAACGTALGLAQSANAQTVINISGATLFANFFAAGASTVDFFDVDGDTRCKDCPGNATDQLANFQLPPSFNTDEAGAGQFWCVQYMAAGSVKGYQALVSFGSPKPYATNAENTPPGLLVNDISQARHNRTVWFGSGAVAGVRNAGNPYGAPVRSSTDGLYTAQFTTPPTPSAGGLRMDIAPLDVDPFWGQQFPGTGAFDKKPGDPGYGRNPGSPVNKDGTTVVGPGSSQQLVDISAEGRTLFSGSGNGDANTIFGTPIVYNTVAAMVNLGVGRSEIRQSDLRHLNATGRLRNGENLVAITREAGSGTRNAFCNSVCLDPSFGVGENVGGDNSSTINLSQNAGPNFLPSNKIGTGDLTGTVPNNRLAIGYSGTETYTNNSLTGRMELLAIKPDLTNGSDAVGSFARPSAFNQIFNNPLRGDNTSGYMIGGIQTFATIGDPLAAPAAQGGTSNGRQPMDNLQASAYINNINKSVLAFTSNPNQNSSTSSPGEFLGINFVFTNVPEFVQQQLNPCGWVANPTFASGATARTFALANSVFGRPANAPFYNNFGQAGLNGRVPTRTTGQNYSDGTTGAATTYILQDATTASYGSTTFPVRNRIAGDFSGNGVRDIGDAADLVAAYRQRTGGPAWIAPDGSGPLAGFLGSTASIEILGDFNSDGNFNIQDVRYFADGLAISGGIADRKAGFTAVDSAFGGNLFGTTKATGNPYANGDSRADIAGGTGRTANFQPIAQDGLVNALDIDFVYGQFRGLGDGVMNWDNTTDAIGKDYGANMTSGDTNVDINDVCEIVRTVLKTTFGDVNLDGVANCADLAVINQPAMPYAGTWATGDVTGDGLVTTADVAQIRGFILPGDLNGDGSVNTTDLTNFLGLFGSAPACNATVFALDPTGTSVTTTALTAFLSRFGTSVTCP
ncbi:MAG: dockerin type I repeat-containing protein [Phycisphaerales bacterium]